MINMCLDVETGGTQQGVTEIIQLGACTFDRNFRIKEKFIELIRPSNYYNITDEALDVNGISLKSLETAPTAMEVKLKFSNWVMEVLDYDTKGKIFPMGHNYGGFDKGFLELFFGFNFYQSLFWYKNRDTYSFAQGLVDSGSLVVEKRHSALSLVDLAEHFDLLHNKHDALGDVITTISVYKKLVEVSNG